MYLGLESPSVARVSGSRTEVEKLEGPMQLHGVYIEIDYYYYVIV